MPLLLRSIEFARSYDITVYDATFLAVAELIDADMIIADERLAGRTAGAQPVRLLG